MYSSPFRSVIFDCRNPVGSLAMLQMKIFLPGSKSTAYMSLRLIEIQNFPGFCRQRRINLKQSFCYVFMYSTLADSKCLRRLPYRCLIFNDIICDLDCPLLNIIFHTKPLRSLFLQCMQRYFFIFLFSLKQLKHQ